VCSSPEQVDSSAITLFAFLKSKAIGSGESISNILNSASPMQMNSKFSICEDGRTACKPQGALMKSMRLPQIWGEWALYPQIMLVSCAITC